MSGGLGEHLAGRDSPPEEPEMVELELTCIFLALKNSFTRTEWEMKGCPGSEEGKIIPPAELCLSMSTLQSLGITIGKKEVTEWLQNDDKGLSNMHMYAAMNSMTQGVLIEDSVGQRKINKRVLLSLIASNRVPLSLANFLGAEVKSSEVEEYKRIQEEASRSHLGRSGIGEIREVNPDESSVRKISRRVRAHSGFSRIPSDFQRGSTSQYPFLDSDTSEAPFFSNDED